MGKAEGIGGSMDRRKLYYFCLGAVILAVVLGVAIGVPLSKRSTSDLDKANQILQKYPLIDGHNDLPWQLYNNAHNQLENVDLTQDTRVQWENSSLPPQTDIPRLITGRLAAQFWAAFVNCRAQEADAVRLTLEQIDVIKRFANKYSQTFQFVTTAQGIEDAFNAGKIGSLIGVEGGHSIDSSLATLRMFYDLGVRYMTITHVCNTPWADASKVDDPNSGIGAQSNGLNDFGKSVIREMNRLGMLVDISHVSKATMEAVLDVSVAPVIHSHSSAWQLCNHDRNVQDDILRKTTTNGGVVMVNFYNNYITCNDNATTQDVADHVDYIKNVAGVDHVGIGADYDGVSRLPQGLEDVSTYPNLFAELLKRGWSEEDLAKLAGGNLLRVFRKAEEIRDNLQQNTPNEELIPESLVSNNTCRLTFKQSVTFG